MKPDIKKIVLLNLPYLVPWYLGNKLSHFYCFLSGGDILDRIWALFRHLDLFRLFPWPSLALKDVIIGCFVAALLKVIVIVKSGNKKKFRKDVEYGSARWGTAKDIAPYIDKDFKNNIILTKTERLTMNSRPKDPKLARNKNVIVIGGSGSGKTRFFVKPNLMQMHSSYVVTDPKGTITIETTAGKGAVTENTVIPVATTKFSNLSRVDNPTTQPTTNESTTIPNETLPPRTDTDQEPTITGSANLAAKEFLSIKTKSGKIFYLIIDRTKTTDNVYLVTEVDEADLMHFTNSDGISGNAAIPLPDSPVEVILPKPSEESPVTDEATEKSENMKPLSLGTIITIIMLLAMAVGGIYYLKVIRPKQQYPSEADFYDEEYMDDMGAYPGEAEKTNDDEMNIT